MNMAKTMNVLKKMTQFGNTAIATRRNPEWTRTRTPWFRVSLRQWGSLLRESTACEFSAGHCNRWVSTESGVKLEAGEAGGWTPELSWHKWEGFTFRYLGVIIGNTKRELSRNKGQIPWLFSRSHPNRQELPKRQSTRPRKGGRPRWIHCPSALKAHAPGFWYCFPLPAIISQFTISVQGSKRGVLSFVHIWRANGSLPNISLSQKSEADLLLLSKESLSEPPILSLPSETQCWPEEMGIPVILDWNIEWTLP